MSENVTDRSQEGEKQRKNLARLKKLTFLLFIASNVATFIKDFVFHRRSIPAVYADLFIGLAFLLSLLFLTIYIRKVKGISAPSLPIRILYLIALPLFYYVVGAVIKKVIF